MRRRAALWLATAFLAGAAVMMLEIVAGRLMAPHFGHSIYLWGALIGVVLAALAAGYALGGLLGDRAGFPWPIFALLAVAGLFVAALPWLSSTVLPLTRTFGPRGGTIAAAVLITLVPCLALASVSPLVVRRLARERLAAAAGSAYAISTLGSIAGTFFAAFYALPELGSRATLLITAALIGATALALAVGEGRRSPAVLAGILLALGFTAPGEIEAGIPIHRAESIYNRIEVVDRDDRRFLYLNDRNGYHSVMVKDALLTGVVHDQFLLAPLLAPKAERLLFLGVAAGVSIRQLASVYPQLQITGVEIDAAVLDVAGRFFGLQPGPNVRLVAEDARWFVEQDRQSYDVIAVDLFQDTSIPPACTSVEFFRVLADRLAPDGMLIMNVFARREAEQVVGPLVRTIGEVLPAVFLYRPYNSFIIASKVPLSADALRARLSAEGVPAEVGAIAAAAAAALATAIPDPRWPVFTDDRNDIEFRAFRAMHGQ